MTMPNLFRFAAPQSFYALAGRLAPWFYGLAAVLALIGLYFGLLVAPADYKQGDSYRIIFIHVPAAWMSMFIYLVMAGYSVLALIFNTRVSAMMAAALAPTGAWMTFVALFTGAFWGKPTWGTYWVWDARITSEFILLFIYLGFMALRASIDDPRKADKAASLLCIVGAVNIPIIYFSVIWWNTLHQGATISTKTGVSMDPIMFRSMMIMVFGYWMYAIGAALVRVRAIIIQRESGAAWVQKEVRA
jgi:heme exporter protein C